MPLLWMRSRVDRTLTVVFCSFPGGMKNFIIIIVLVLVLLFLTYLVIMT